MKSASAALVAAFALSATAAQASPRVSQRPLRSQFAVPNEIVAAVSAPASTSAAGTTYDEARTFTVTVTIDRIKVESTAVVSR